MIGKAGVGKDTIADVLVRTKNYNKYNIADILKEECAKNNLLPVQLFYDRDLKDKKLLCNNTKSPRELLIETANIIRSKYNTNFFVKETCNKIRNNENIVIADCRFPNEIKYFETNKKFKNYDIIKVWIDRKIKLKVFDNLQLEKKDCDIIIDNNKDHLDKDYEEYILYNIKENE